MIRQLSLASMLMAGLFAADCSSDDNDSLNVVGDTVTVANTFEDTGITGGLQTIFGVSDAIGVGNRS